MLLLLGLGSTLAGAALVLLAAVVLLMLLGGTQLAAQQACDPATQAAAPIGASAHGRASIPPAFVAIYLGAAARFQLGADGWLWLAAIHHVETDFNRDLATSSAGAQGPMQFMPDTWRSYGVDGDHDGHADIQNTTDAIYGAANYLHASGAPRDWHHAIYAYNHAEWYYQDVLRDQTALAGDPSTPSAPPTTQTDVPRTQMVGLPSASRGPALTPALAATPATTVEAAPGTGCAPANALPGTEIPTVAGERAQLTPQGLAVAPQDAPAQVKQVLAAGNQINGRPYVYGGGHGPPLTAPVASYDCSSSISFILHQAALFPDPTAWISGAFAQSYGDPGPGRWVTLRANEGHIYMYVAGLRWDTHRWDPGDRGVPGIGWHTAQRPDTGFTARHPHGL